jgi:hypothetical protein
VAAATARADKVTKGILPSLEGPAQDFPAVAFTCQDMTPGDGEQN